MSRATPLAAVGALAGVLMVLAAFSLRLTGSSRRPESLLGPLPPGELVLHIQSGHRRLALQQWPVIHAQVLNRASAPVRLVLPGEGSVEGLRTPTLQWIVRRVGEATRPPSSGSRLPQHCGNVAALDASELAPPVLPGEALKFRPPAGAGLYFRRPGVYTVRLIYENRPREKWGAWRMLAPVSEALWASLQGTKDCRLVSNELRFEVAMPRQEKPAA